MSHKPYLLFIGDAGFPALAKTAFGVRDWAPEACVAQWRLPGCKVDLQLPDMRPKVAREAGARSMLIGIAPIGGRIPDHWTHSLIEAAESGLNIVSGMHQRLQDIPGLAEAAARAGVALVNVRTPPTNLPVGTGIRRSGKRLLTVGTDCALGKKYTALTLARAMRERGIDADFRATGQTGILIAGSGIPIDSVVADFIAGAAEALSPDAAEDHWDIIEGQGSLIHPGYAGVTLGLVHGSQPDAIVLCHEPGRTVIIGSEHIAIPPLGKVARMYLEAASLTNPHVRLVGVSLNTSALSESERARALAEAERDLNVPSFDPLKTPAAPVVDFLLDATRD
jgi:uncharacterized NAD-dependent epimerase/dehydratase family protein